MRCLLVHISAYIMGPPLLKWYLTTWSAVAQKQCSLHACEMPHEGSDQANKGIACDGNTLPRQCQTAHQRYFCRLQTYEEAYLLGILRGAL